MKQKLILIVLLLTLWMLNAAYLVNEPEELHQPDGSIIRCYSSGDEFFNYYHDADGFPLIEGEDGFFYYALLINDEFIPSQLRVTDQADKQKFGLQPNVKISAEKYWNVRKKMDLQNQNSKAPHTGVLNNPVIYIKFADDQEFATTRRVYDKRFNGLDTISVRKYYKEVSYNNLDIKSYHYPIAAMNTNLSYTDSHNRSYFQKNTAANPNGYSGEAERTSREHKLLEDAVNWINQNSPIPDSLSLDGDNDGKVDNVCFVIKGSSGSWNELLWAHRWVLYSKEVYIGTKRVYDYTFQPENQVTVKTLCHEMFHALGAPDLYHYSQAGPIPAGQWDIMESGSGSMTSWMKYKYANKKWIREIPEIIASGRYTLFPLTDSTRNCYKIKSNQPDEFYVVEYRKKNGVDTSLPNNGLLVWRINTKYNGNANYNGSTVFDEVYVYRKNGAAPNISAETYYAYYSVSAGRTAINSTTTPKGFLTNGSDGGLNITQIGSAVDSISFYVTIPDNPSQIDQDLKDKPISLYTNYPNPFNPQTTISFHNSQDGQVNLSIYNSNGELVEELVNRNIQPGDYSFVYDASQLNSGIYFYRLKGHNRSYTGKMMLIK